MNAIIQNIENKLKEANTNQKNAIESVIEGWEGKDNEFNFPIVEGPPGTGKTTVGVLSAARYVITEKRPQIAYLAFTNFAADKAHEDFIQKLKIPSKCVIRLHSRPGERDWDRGRIGCKSDLSDLTPEEIRKIQNAKILISTLNSSGRIFKTFKHPLILIDEFSQVSPAMFFSTIAGVSTSTHNPAGYALLGDPNQLPVITTQELLRSNIGLYIISRKYYQSHQLDMQYRMHKNVCEVVNGIRKALNTYPLTTHDTVKNNTLHDLGYIWNSDAIPSDYNEIIKPENPVVVINTDNLPGYEQQGFGNSTYYTSEAILAARLAHFFNNSYHHKNGGKLIPTILTPYNAQLGEIKGCLEDPMLSSSSTTIYKSQGREYPCVIISFARKNQIGNIGLLKNFETIAQTYVGCSRAMAKLVLLFSFNTFIGHGFRDFEYMMERCEHSATIIDSTPAEWGEET